MLFDSDEDDDALQFESDDLIQNIKKSKSDENFNWDHIQEELKTKIDKLLLAAEKLDYLLMAITASDVGDEVVSMSLPHLVSLYDDLYDNDDKVRCACVVARYSSVAQDIEQAMDVLETLRSHVYYENTRKDALSLLLNDPRSFAPEQAVRRAEQHSLYYQEWKDLIENDSESEKAYAAYDFLVLGRTYNGFKTDIIKIIFENIRHVEDPQAQLDMILQCNQTLPSQEEKEDYYANQIDIGFIPKIYKYNWEPLFYRSVLRCMQVMEKPDFAISYLANQTSEASYDSWVQDASVTVTSVMNMLDIEDLKLRNCKLQAESKTVNFKPRCAADMLKKPDKFLDYAASLHDLMYEDDADREDKEVANQKEFGCLYQLSSSYNMIQQKIKRSRYKDRDSQLLYCQFKHDFLMAVCSGDPISGVTDDYAPLNDDIGLWPTAVNYANQQLCQNNIVRDYLLTEKNLIEAQKKVAVFKQVEYSDDILEEDFHYGYDPALFKTVVNKGDNPYRDRGEQKNIYLWNYKDPDDGEYYTLSVLDLTLQPN